MIYVKKTSKNSLIFANGDSFGRRFYCPKKLEKANVKHPTPLVYSKNDLKVSIGVVSKILMRILPLYVICPKFQKKGILGPNLACKSINLVWIQEVQIRISVKE